MSVLIAALGLCEHCQTTVNIEGMPVDAGTIVCPSCHREIGHASFGYDDASGSEGKKRWVGPDGAWTTEKPTEGFTLPDGTEVIVRTRPFWR